MPRAASSRVSATGWFEVGRAVGLRIITRLDVQLSPIVNDILSLPIATVFNVGARRWFGKGKLALEFNGLPMN
jgi:hypothetical protein